MIEGKDGKKGNNEEKGIMRQPESDKVRPPSNDIFDRPSRGDFDFSSTKKTGESPEDKPTKTSPTEHGSTPQEKTVFELGEIETVEGRRELSIEEVGEGLAATGNNEAKAILLSAMEKGKPYAEADLWELKKLVEGGYPGWEGMKREHLSQYCSNSFARAGLVEERKRTIGEKEQIEFIKTEKGAMLDPFNGQMLHFSERHPNYSLQDIFPGASPGAKPEIKDDAKEAQMGVIGKASLLRFKILQQLIGKNAPSRLADLAQKLGEDPTIVGRHLKSLDNKKLIAYKSTAFSSGESKLEFTHAKDQPGRDPSPYSSYPTLTKKVYDIVTRLEGNIQTNDIYAKLVEEREPSDKKESKPGVVKGKISEILRHFEKEGYLENIGIRNEQRSEISLTLSQKGVINELVTIVEKFQKGDDRDFLNDGVQKMRHIVGNPARAAQLLRKAQEKSPYAGKAKPEETKKQIERIVAGASGGLSNQQIKEALQKEGNDLSEASIKRFTVEMRRAGELSGTQKGRTFFYRPGKKESPSESDKED